MSDKRFWEFVERFIEFAYRHGLQSFEDTNAGWVDVPTMFWADTSRRAGVPDKDWYRINRTLIFGIPVRHDPGLDIDALRFVRG